MTDITDIKELAQRDKFEEWEVHACAALWGYLKKRRTTKGYSEHIYTCMWTAWKAAGGELEVALAKYDKKLPWVELIKTLAARNTVVHSQDVLFIAEVYERYIAAVSPENMRQMMAELDAARQRIAELESRTVKLPERYSCDLGYNGPDPNGDMLARDDVLAMLSAAGIKWEAE